MPGRPPDAHDTDSSNDDGLAPIVSFAEAARLRGRVIGEAVDDDVSGGPGGNPEEAEDGEGADGAVIAQEAMFRRMQTLSPEGKTLRSIDDELATLVFDSADVGDESLLVRGTLSGRQLTFEGPDLLLEVHVEGRRREMTCQVVPPQVATLEVRHSKGTIDLGADDFGTFYATELPAGRVSLRCVPLAGTARATSTSWVSL